MIEKYKQIIMENIEKLLPLEKIQNEEITLYKTPCIVSKKQKSDNIHFMYYNPVNGIFTCPVCGFSKDLVALSASITGKDEWAMLECILRKKLKMDTRSLIRDMEAEKFKYELLYQINYNAMIFYKEQLKSSKEAVEYLKKRGLTDETIARFHLGYAPKYNKLYKTLKENFSVEALEEAGVIGIDEKTGRPYDIFKDRIIFPIIDENQQVLGFGGRALKENPKKYINTKTTPIFQKAMHLYGINKLKKEEKYKYILVCEGYMDVISLHQAGIDFAVATLGTAMTSHHYVKLLQFTNKPVAVFDGDDAGKNAAERALKKIGKLNVLTLPENLDPDEFIKKYDIKRFLEYMDSHVQSWEEYWYQKYVQTKQKGNIFEYFLKQSEEIQKLF